MYCLVCFIGVASTASFLFGGLQRGRCYSCGFVNSAGPVVCVVRETALGLKKRGWVDIYIDILESASSPLNKTRLMYRSNLNFVRFNAYFSEFLRKGLLVEAKNYDGRGRAYVVSKHGKVLLAALKNAEKLFSES